jgi:hypothetical protein
MSVGQNNTVQSNAVVLLQINVCNQVDRVSVLLGVTEENMTHIPLIQANMTNLPQLKPIFKCGTLWNPRHVLSLKVHHTLCPSVTNSFYMYMPSKYWLVQNNSLSSNQGHQIPKLRNFNCKRRGIPQPLPLWNYWSHTVTFISIRGSYRHTICNHLCSFSVHSLLHRNATAHSLHWSLLLTSMHCTELKTWLFHQLPDWLWIAFNFPALHWAENTDSFAHSPTD